MTKPCPSCGFPMPIIPHVEYDGDLGSPEPYYECVQGCEDNEDKNYERV